MSRDSILEVKLAKLYSQRNSGIKLGLEVMRCMMHKLGDPQEHFASVHVAGTNGKGSVCAMLSSIFREAGLRTGLYISPHLVEFNERMSVDGVNADDRELLEAAEEVDSVISPVNDECGREPTFFEYSTAMAMLFFKRKKVQFAVLETGMGGRLDATNIVNPLVSVVTRISLEHTEYLGPDIPSIAGEKAGIVKEGRPVVCGPMPAEAMAVIRKTALDRHSLFRDVQATVAVNMKSMGISGTNVEVSTDQECYGLVKTRFIGVHQLENIATAVAAAEEAGRAMGGAFPADIIRAGLGKASWPGRFHVLSSEPAVVLDGGHNPGAAEVLAASLKKLFPGRPVGMVIGMCGDKDTASFLAAFRGVHRFWAVTIRNERAVPADRLAEIIRNSGFQCDAVSLEAALEQSSEWAGTVNGVVCIAGSLFLAGEVLERKGLM